jgi:HPt (histidine-containing phosphotransfer) domain-containing protein
MDSVSPNDPIYPRLLEYFCEDSKQMLPAIGQYLASGQLAEVQNMAHSIKSSAALLGFEDVAELSEKLEQLCRQTPHDKLNQQQIYRQMMSAFEEAFLKLDATIKEEAQNG